MTKKKIEDPAKKLRKLGKVLRKEINEGLSLTKKEMGDIRAAIGVQKVNYQKHKEKDKPELFRRRKHEL